MNGHAVGKTMMCSAPVLSPCSRIVKAKQLIVSGREKEAEGKLEEALKEYEEGREERKA